MPLDLKAFRHPGPCASDSETSPSQSSSIGGAAHVLNSNIRTQVDGAIANRVLALQNSERQNPSPLTKGHWPLDHGHWPLGLGPLAAHFFSGLRGGLLFGLWSTFFCLFLLDALVLKVQLLFGLFFRGPGVDFCSSMDLTRALKIY